MKITRSYGCKRMTLRPISKAAVIDGRDTTIISDAQIKLEDLSELRFPLLWSRPFPIKEARALLSLFEATGIDTII